jgi:predicted ferric reductase
VNFYNIHLQKDGFEKNIEADLKNSSISKIWVCGPPKMNEGMTKFVSEDLRQPELLHLL